MAGSGLSEKRTSTANFKMDYLNKMMKSANEEILDFDAEDEDGNNLLHLTSANGNEDMVEFLLQRGFSVNGTNKCGWTPLMQAARYGHTAAAQVLIKYGAHALATNKLGITALECAARSGHLAIVKEIAKSQSQASNTSELTPLMVASQCRNNAVVQLLLSTGVDINQSFQNTGLTALMLAVSNGHGSTARILVEHGASVTALNNRGKSAYDIAVQRGKRQMQCFLNKSASVCDRSGGETTLEKLFEAIQLENVDALTSLIKTNKEIINGVDKKYRQTPLLKASILGRLEMVKLLVKSGAFIDCRDSEGYTPLMRAISFGLSEVAFHLIGVGADINLCLPNKSWIGAFEIATLVAHANDDVVTALTETLGYGNSYPTKSGHELKSWWNITSKYFKKKTKKSASLDNLQRLSSSTECVSKLSQAPPAAWKDNGILGSDVAYKMISADPCEVDLVSNRLPTVESPLQSCGLDANSSFRYGMPQGIKVFPDKCVD